MTKSLSARRGMYLPNSRRLRDGFVNVQALDLRGMLALTKLVVGIGLAVNDCHNGFEDFVIASAATKIARHPFLDFVFARFRVLVEQRLGRDDLTRRADAALKTAVLDEGLLQRMELAVPREPFDGLDALAGAAGSQGQARAHQAPVDDDAAGAADADAAAFLGSGQAQVVAQNLQQQAVGLDLDLMFLAVDPQGDRALHRQTDLPEWVLPQRARMVLRVSPSPTETRVCLSFSQTFSCSLWAARSASWESSSGQ